MIKLNPDKLNNLVQQIESQCPDIESLLTFIKKRLEGEINTAKALTFHPTYAAKEERFKQQGFNHPLINTLLQQHRLLAAGADQHLTHSYADRKLKGNLGNRL